VLRWTRAVRARTAIAARVMATDIEAFLDRQAALVREEAEGAMIIYRVIADDETNICALA
jgi:hypothetical protein